MAKDHLVYISLRVNVNNPQHEKVNNVLKNFNESIKSKNQFFMDAAEYYIDNIGSENLTVEGEKEKERQAEFVTRKEFDDVMESMKRDSAVQIREEMIRLLGGALLGGVPHVDMSKKKVEDDYYQIEEDDTLQGLADQWS
ncbi:MAG: hypothetical protein R3Y58_10270 [Eubacteriales bacterium]